jgi:uncharacterized membrane protein YqjE
VKNFLTCELFIFLKLFGLTLLVILIVNIIGATGYLKAVLMASIVVFLIYIIVFIWKFFKVLMMDDSSKYECEKKDTLKRALTWLLNIVY